MSEPLPPFKELTVHDLHSPDKQITFTRPSEHDTEVVIFQNFAGRFCLSASTLRLVAEILDKH